jgi:hypothetical protein
VASSGCIVDVLLEVIIAYGVLSVVFMPASGSIVAGAVAGAMSLRIFQRAVARFHDFQHFCCARGEDGPVVGFPWISSSESRLFNGLRDINGARIFLGASSPSKRRAGGAAEATPKRNFLIGRDYSDF